MAIGLLPALGETMAAVTRSDAELVAATADNDRAAMRELYDRHAPWVRARLRRRCADLDMVDEAVQETFVAVWRGAQGWTGTGEPAAWIWGIAIRRLVGVVRSRSRWAPVANRTSEPGPAAGAEELVLEGIEHGALAAAMTKLTPDLQAVIQATVLDGLTTREAADLLGIPTGTVKTRTLRARQQLRGALT